MISWHEYYLGIAKAVARRSKDPRTRVGAVLVNSANHIIATGYNGCPPGFPEPGTMWHSEEKYDYVVHAEMNALLHSTGPLKGATLYVTMYPCKECAKAICSAGISKVYYLDPKYQSEIADKLFKSCGIDVELIIGGTSGAEG